jgi:CRP/FNR family transcriptional regulator
VARDGLSRPGGPAISAVHLWLPGSGGHGRPHQLLSEQQREHLRAIATVVRFKKGEEIYSGGEPAHAIFNIIAGVVKMYQSGVHGPGHITGFLYPQDLFGLSEEGCYTNSATAVTAVTAYRLPVSAVRQQLSKDAELQFHFIASVCHHLRQAQRHALLLAQRRATARLARFLQLQEYLQSANGASPEIYLPMDRRDVADYVGMTLAAVSRGFRDLEARGAISHRDRRHVKIVDRKALEELASETGGAPAGKPSRSDRPFEPVH